MEKFMKGDVVVIPFPFSDLSAAKKRPALILSVLEGDDLILCQITSRQMKDKYSIELTDSDFKAGSLKQSSSIRPNKMFTADKSIIQNKVGTLRESKIEEVVQKACNLLKD